MVRAKGVKTCVHRGDRTERWSGKGTHRAPPMGGPRGTMCYASHPATSCTTFATPAPVQYHEKYPGTEGLGSDSSANSPDDGRPPLTDGKGKKQDGQLLPLSESRQWQAKRKGSSGCKEARPAGGSAAGEQEQQAAAALGEDESAALGDNEQQQGPQGSRDVHVPKGDGVEEQQEEEQPPPEMGGGQEQEEVDQQPAEEEEEPPEVDVSDSLLSTSSSAEYVALRTPLVPPTRSSPIKPTITHLVHLRKGGMGRAH